MANLAYKEKTSPADFDEKMIEEFGVENIYRVKTVRDLAVHLHSDDPLSLYYHEASSKHIGTYNHKSGYGWIFESAFEPNGQPS